MDETSGARRDETDLGATARRCRTHDRQELAPFDNAREEHECNARRIVSPSRSDPAFDVTRKLLAEEEVRGGQLPTGPDHEPQQAQQVSEEGERCSEHVG